MDDERNIELRSEKIRHIIGAMPPWILRYGIAVIVVLTALLVAITAYIPYPQTIDAQAQVTGTEGDSCTLTALLPYDRISRVACGMEALVYPEGYDSGQFVAPRAIVTAIDSAVIVDSDVRYFACTLATPAPSVMRAGMVARVQVIVAQNSLLRHIFVNLVK